ncbi:CLUMA_CG012579, isoform A [Clunio marinus]|uniref:Calcium channel flower n=1 Tax=Clunio marinus TaxID=568069 RepID=A0A1J1IHN8_9DIPT|nr:CLUMA_CG012579, isoform A [Clunio marinus]
MDKIIGLLNKASPNAESQVDDGTPWYFKYGSRLLGIVGAFFCVLFGLWNCLSILFAKVYCLVSGIIQVCVGFIVMAIEAPFCCMFIDHVQTMAGKVEQRPLWNRAAFYCIISIVPVVLCPGLGSIFGCGLVFGSGVIYGLMGLGKKGTREDMAAVASPTSQPISNDQHNILIEDDWKS